MAGTGDIRGNTGSIRSTASEIREDAKAYGDAANTLFDTVNALGSSYTSVDGQAFIAKINSYREDFDKLQAALSASAEALETVAINYENTIKANTI